MQQKTGSRCFSLKKRHERGEKNGLTASKWFEWMLDSHQTTEQDDELD